MLSISSRFGAALGAASVVLACAAQVQAAPAAVKSVVFSTDYNAAASGPGTPIGVTTTFKPSAKKIHCAVRLTKLDSRAVVRTVWFVESSPGIPANTKAYEDKVGPLKNLVLAHFTLSNSNTWPLGRYKVDVYLNGKYIRTARFSVK
ncbi:hypothetical protein IAD21_05037 [Abditibacteriota bacterium]|nr:hypothetical protein IAD21_05037 [Abditibacteriota bacterium]